MRFQPKLFLLPAILALSCAITVAGDQAQDDKVSSVQGSVKIDPVPTGSGDRTEHVQINAWRDSAGMGHGTIQWDSHYDNHLSSSIPPQELVRRDIEVTEYIIIEDTDTNKLVELKGIDAKRDGYYSQVWVVIQQGADGYNVAYGGYGPENPGWYEFVAPIYRNAGWGSGSFNIK